MNLLKEQERWLPKLSQTQRLQKLELQKQALLLTIVIWISENLYNTELSKQMAIQSLISNYEYLMVSTPLPVMSMEL